MQASDIDSPSTLYYTSMERRLQRVVWGQEGRVRELRNVRGEGGEMGVNGKGSRCYYLLRAGSFRFFLRFFENSERLMARVPRLPL